MSSADGGAAPWTSRPATVTPAEPAPLGIRGVEGRIAREVIELARERYGVDAVSTVLRTPGQSPTARTDSTAHDHGHDHGHPTVVHVALSTDLQLDLGVDTAVRRAALVEITRSAEEATARGGHLVVVTSARVFGARPDNPVPMSADAPLRARDDRGLIGDLLTVETEIAHIRERRPDLHVTVVRPAAVVGPGVDTTITRHFESPRLLVIGGSAPLWQFVHVADLAAAIMTVVTHEPVGALGPVVTVGADDPITQERVERISGKRRLELPATAAMSTARRLHAAGVLSTSGDDLDYVRYPWAVSATALQEAGWRAVHDNETCLQVLLEGIRGDRGMLALRRDAAVGTASAAVALVGTAALMRRRRRKGA